MASEQEKKPLKWYTLRRVKLTGEYLGGLIAGFGGGVGLMSMIFGQQFILFWVGMLLVYIGAGLAFHTQDRYER